MAFCADIPQFNRWVQVSKDMAGARPGSALRYVPESHAFFLWGFMNDDPDLLQEQPLMSHSGIRHGVVRRRGARMEESFPTRMGQAVE